RGHYDLALRPKRVDNQRGLLIGGLELVDVVVADLGQDIFRGHNGMIAIRDRNDPFTDSVRCDAGQQHVCVEYQPHEMTLKMSSSVRKPWASARGSVARRIALSCSVAINRRSDSRTSSLAGRCCWRLNSSSWSLRSSGIRRVRVVMYYIVTHRLRNVDFSAKS